MTTHTLLLLFLSFLACGGSSRPASEPPRARRTASNRPKPPNALETNASGEAAPASATKPSEPEAAPQIELPPIVRHCAEELVEPGDPERRTLEEWAWDATGTLRRHFTLRDTEESEQLFTGDARTRGGATMHLRGPLGPPSAHRYREVVTGRRVLKLDEVWEGMPPPNPEDGILFTYGRDGRVASISQYGEEPSHCRYDHAGRIVALEAPMALFTYEYDARGQLVRVEHEEESGAYITRITRDGTGLVLRFATQTRPNQVDPSPMTGRLDAGCEDVFFHKCAPSLAPAPPHGARYQLPAARP